MRPITTLKSNPEFRLPAQERRSGFISMYNGNPGMSAYSFVFKLTSRLIWPWLANVEDEPRNLKEYINKRVKDPTRKAVFKSVLRKNQLTKTLEFRTPIFHTPAVGPEYLKVICPTELLPKGLSIDQREGIKGSVNTLADTVFGSGAIIAGSQVVEMCKFTGRVGDTLRKCLTSIEAVEEDGQFLIFATWKINQKEAEYLNNVPFAQIKLSNVYPTLTDWAANCIGKDINLPSTICPVTSITTGVEAAKAKGPIPPRTGMSGAVVDVNRNYYIIPDVNAGLEYEQAMMEFGIQDDGSYTWHHPSAVGETEIPVGGVQTTRKKLPINMPIYADWLNDKFVYSNSAGNLAVYDLSNTAPVNNFHIRSILEASVSTDVGDNSMSPVWSVLSTSVGLAASFDRSIWLERPKAEELPEGAARDYLENRVMKAMYGNLSEMAKDAFQLHLLAVGHTDDLFMSSDNKVTVRVHQLATLPSFSWIFRVLQRAKQKLQDNLEVMYTRYSVMNVLQQSAVLTLVVDYSSKAKEVEAADKAERDVYITQGVDEEAPIEAVPGIRKGLRYQPHQAKIQNVLRRGPKFASLPVDAGGGKTISILTNILLEIKRGYCRKPIIMCPAHLVAQYVKEAVFVTEGRINVIPVTNSTLKAHGEEKLAKFIMNAPINTIVVTDFNFLKGRRQLVAYGNKSLEIFRNAEFMRQFEFDLVAIDESHYLKNIRSSRRSAAARFMQDIPMKRIASGTMVSDTLKDLVSQIALLDPVIFGSEEAFKDEFASKTRGSKVMAWKEGAEKQVRARIAEHCVVAQARRKEWAALLPPKKERFVGVELTKNQRLLYESILAETMELIQEAMTRDAEVRDMMESEDDSKAEELEAKLRPYLARLERFMSAPAADQAAQLFLSDPMDLISPKVLKVYDICRAHLNENVPGKIIIFTQYTASAQSVYDNAPPDLKPYFIHYTADQKAECKTEFENDDKKKIMVGVSSSMDTGLNLQFASRLIRMETVWTPGILEQGNSRINRPELKGTDDRNTVYFDWIVINRSVDITKVARLVSKIISKAKFDESENPAYDALEPVDSVPMTMESIAANNDFNEELLPYLEKYQTYQAIEEQDYADYKAQQGDKAVMHEVPTASLYEDSKLMSRVPYVPEMELYGVDKLGLVRYDHFIRQDMEATEEDTETDVDEDDDENEEMDDGVAVDPAVLKRRAFLKKLGEERALTRGKAAHTDFGDGTIVSVGRKFVKVRLPDGTTVRLPKLQVYIITRSTTNGVDMRNELLKQVGKIPLDAPIKVPVETGNQDKQRAKKGREAKDKLAPPEKLAVTEFDFTVMNDFLALMYRGDGSDSDTVSTLQAFNFKITPQYNYVRVLGPKTMLRFVKALKAAGFTLTKENSSELKRIYEALKTNKSAMSTFGFATKMDVTNFFRAQIKPSADPQLLKIYPLVQDNILYLMFPTKGQAANQKAKRVSVPSATWRSSQDMELIRLFGNKGEAKQVVQEMRDAGLNIPDSNIKELGEQFKKIRLVVR